MQRIEIPPRSRALKTRAVVVVASLNVLLAWIFGEPGMAVRLWVTPALVLLVSRAIWLASTRGFSDARFFLALMGGMVASLIFGTCDPDSELFSGYRAVYFVGLLTVVLFGVDLLVQGGAQGRKVVLDEVGISMEFRFPWKRSRALRWGEVDTFQSQIRPSPKGEERPTKEMRRRGNFVELRGRGKRLRIDSNSFRLVEGHVLEIGKRSGPATREWLRKRLASGKRTDLGAIELLSNRLVWKKTGESRFVIFGILLMLSHMMGTVLNLSIKRWLNTFDLPGGVAATILVLTSVGMTVGFFWGMLRFYNRRIRRRNELLYDHITGISIEGDHLQIKSDRGRDQFDLARIRNGIWLPQVILERLRGVSLGGAAHLDRVDLKASFGRKEEELPLGCLSLSFGLYFCLVMGAGGIWGIYSLWFQQSDAGPLERTFGTIFSVLGTVVGTLGSLGMLFQIFHSIAEKGMGVARRFVIRPRLVVVNPEEEVRRDGRSVRVFVSSTFRDMHEEREALIKRVFPDLRKLCESRNVSFCEIDLRWGITEEKAQRGEVIPTCLEEIDRCRPFFIGLLGERYGEAPETIPATLLEREPWLGENGMSYTEIEIRHAVLRNPDPGMRASFYFRDQSWTPDHQDEAPNESFVESDPGKKRQLNLLKDELRSSSYLVREDYPSPNVLGDWVLEDLAVAIENEFPQEEEQDPLDLIAAQHESWARLRLGLYVGRREMMDALDEHVRNGDSPVIVNGESGAGKSALLANWAYCYRRENPEELVVEHYVGAGPGSADLGGMLRRFIGELQRHFELEVEIPEEEADLANCFVSCLSMVAEQGVALFVIDALDKLEGLGARLPFDWIPEQEREMESIRFVVSALGEGIVEKLMERSVPVVLDVESLTSGERREIVVHSLRRYSKELEPSLIRRIIRRPQTASPLYLRVLLEELRVFGKYEQLSQRVTRYLEARNCLELFDRVLTRYEKDYDLDRPGLTGEAMSLIAVSRDGLAEAELLEMLGTGGEPMPAAWWSPLFLAAEQSLVRRSGLISFSHDYLRRAVEARYLSQNAEVKSARKQLVAYFMQRRSEVRGVVELPYQLMVLEDWSQIYFLLSDLEFLVAASDLEPSPLPGLVTRMEVNSKYRLADACRAVIDAPSQYPEAVFPVAALLLETAHSDKALSLWQYLVSHHEARGEIELSVRALNELGRAYDLAGDSEEAAETFQKMENLCWDHELWYWLPLAIGNLGVQLERVGAWEDALKEAQREEQVSREIDHPEGLQHALGLQANSLLQLGQDAEVLPLLQEQERLCREMGASEWVASCLHKQGEFHLEQSYRSEALSRFQEEERILREVGDLAGLEACLECQLKICTELSQRFQALLISSELAELRGEA